MNKTGFYDPADDKKPDGSPVDTLRTSAVYKAKTSAFLNGVRGRTGTTQTTANLLLEKLYDELVRNGITEYDPDAYETAVGGCKIVLGLHGSSADGDATGSQPACPAETAQGNDRRGTVGVGRPAAGTSNVRPNAGSARTRNSRKVRKGGSETEG